MLSPLGDPLQTRMRPLKKVPVRGYRRGALLARTGSGGGDSPGQVGRRRSWPDTYRGTPMGFRSPPFSRSPLSKVGKPEPRGRRGITSPSRPRGPPLRHRSPRRRAGRRVAEMSSGSRILALARSVLTAPPDWRVRSCGRATSSWKAAAHEERHDTIPRQAPSRRVGVGAHPVRARMSRQRPSRLSPPDIPLISGRTWRGSRTCRCQSRGERT